MIWEISEETKEETEEAEEEISLKEILAETGLLTIPEEETVILTEERLRCTQLYATSAVKNAKSLSNQLPANQSIAAHVSETKKVLVQEEKHQEG